MTAAAQLRQSTKPRENRVPIMMATDELVSVDDWRFQNRVATRSDAIRRLVKLGLSADTAQIQTETRP